MLPSKSPILVPERGAQNPLFGEVDSADIVEATILFRGALTEAQLDDAELAVLAWFGGAEWGGRLPILVDETLTSTCLHVAVTGVKQAQHALGLLLHTLVGVGTPVSRAIFSRLPAHGDRDALVLGMDPAARPQVEYDDPRDWWRACFDPSAAPPLSEDRAELARDDDALLEIGDTTYAERRGLPLHVPDVRICHGLGDAAFDDTASPRGRDLARVLRVALAARFGAGDGAPRPVFYNHKREEGAALDAIRAGDRVGYSCAFRAADLREFLHDHLFRYREYELMLAARDAVRALDLEPVVCWRRVRGRYVLQLWERSASHLHAAA